MKCRLAILLHGWALRLEPRIAATVELHVQARVHAAIEEYDRRMLAAHRAHVARAASNN